MPLPTNVRPNPYQALADQQWGDVVRAEEITPRQGLNPRSIIGHPSLVASQALDADDIAYGQMPVANGTRAAGWEAAANARAAEASQTLQLHGMLGAAYGRRSGVGNRALRVRRMPVSALYGTRGLGDTYLPVSRLDQGPAHFRGLGGLTDIISQGNTSEQWASSCAAFDDKAMQAAVGAMVLTAPATDATAFFDQVGVVFGDQNAACAMMGAAGTDIRPAMEQPATKAALERLAASGALAGKGYGALLGMVALYAACDGDDASIARAIEAGEKMTAKGWWETDKWEFKWKYLSGYTLWYKNPLYLGGGAVGGLVLYSMAKKKKKGRR